MLIGYARVSTYSQTLDLQKDALIQAGCEKIFSDIAAGRIHHRSGFTRALAALQKGDTLVVWKLDRLGRSLSHLMENINHLEALGVTVRSLTEDIDCTTPEGRFMMQMSAILAESESNLTRERTLAGVHAARVRGRRGGRPKTLIHRKITRAKALYADNRNSIRKICKTLNISKATLYRYLKS